MAYNIGLNVIEVDGAGAPALVGAATSVAGFNITTQRGIANRPSAVTSYKQFSDQFGAMMNASYGAYMVKGFFDNGGQMAYINRVVSSDATAGTLAATHTFNDSASSATLKALAGQLGTADPGAWGNHVYVKIDGSNAPGVRILEVTPATITGTALAGTTDMSALPTISVKVDNEATATAITFANTDFGDPTKAKPTEIRDAINKRTSKLQASITPDSKLQLQSTGQIARIANTFTKLEITAAVAQLGLTAGPVSGTPAPITATGTTLQSSDSFAPGDAIQISDGTLTQITKVLRATPSTGGIEWIPAITTPDKFDGTQATVTKLQFQITVAYNGTDARERGRNLP